MWAALDSCVGFPNRASRGPGPSPGHHPRGPGSRFDPGSHMHRLDERISGAGTRPLKALAPAKRLSGTAGAGEFVARGK
jgi:hypothetical protein